MIIKKEIVSTRKEIEKEGRITSLWVKGKEYFDPKILEDWLPWKAKTITEYIKSGKIGGKKLGGKWLVTRENLYRFLRGE